MMEYIEGVVIAAFSLSAKILGLRDCEGTLVCANASANRNHPTVYHCDIVSSIVQGFAIGLFPSSIDITTSHLPAASGESSASLAGAKTTEIILRTDLTFRDPGPTQNPNP